MSKKWLIAVIAVLSVLPAGCDRNRPPETPARPAGPGAAAPGDTVEFRLVSRDPEEQSVSFRCSWGDGDTSGWSLWTGSGETLGVLHAWPRVGRYEVTAQARDLQGALSGWSEALEVVVGNPPRRPTRPDGPGFGWVDTSYSYTTVSTDLDGDDIRYVFDWGDGAIETTGFEPSGRYVTRSHAWTRPDTFDLAVRALDRPGLPSPWSETVRVAVRDISGPGVALWRHELEPGAQVFGVAAVDAQGRVLFGATDGYLRCLEPGGGEAWRFAARGEIRSSPAVSADRGVVFGASDSSVYRLTAEGSPAWEFPTGGEVRSSPALGPDGRVYVGSDDGRLYCLDADGGLRWSYETGARVRSSPALGPDGTVYFGSGDSFIYALDRDGALKWRYRTGDAVDASPALGDNGTVYVAGRDGRLYALDAEGGLRWQEEIGPGTVSSPAVASDGNVYAGSEDGRLLAFTPAGGVLWDIAVPDPVRSSPLVADGLIILFGAGRRLYAVNSFGAGSFEWDLTLVGRFEAPPAVAEDGTIYIGDSAGSFWAIRGSGGLDRGAWPKFRRDPANTGQR